MTGQWRVPVYPATTKSGPRSVKILSHTWPRSVGPGTHRYSHRSTCGYLQLTQTRAQPYTADIWRKIVALHHDSHIAGHLERWKTLELVAQNYWWPHMSPYIGQYTATCDLCLWTKVLKQPPTGHLELLPTPDTWWDTVSVDFIVELPESDGCKGTLCAAFHTSSNSLPQVYCLLNWINLRLVFRHLPKFFSQWSLSHKSS